jgi:DNA primase
MREQILALLAKYLPGPFKPSGSSNILTRCPFHKGGEEKTPSFSVNVEKAIFNCFTCHESGNIQQLLRMMNIPRVTVDAEAAFLRPLLDKNREMALFEKKHVFVDRDPFKADYILPESILGVYEWMPLKLVEDGFDPNLLKYLEVGFDKANLRITYPLRDMYGNLAGFSAGATQADQKPKYKVYQGGKRLANGYYSPGDFGPWFDEQFPGYRCENHDFLWNYDRVHPRVVGNPGKDSVVYVVEGFKACMWMIQNGYINTVALMGSYISDRQQQMLHRLGGTVVLCLDNDDAGKMGTIKIGELLWNPMYGRIKVINYPKGDTVTQPDDYEPQALYQMVNESKSFVDFFNQSK